VQSAERLAEGTKLWVNSWQGQQIFSSAKCPGQLWNIHSLLFNGTRIQQLGYETDHTPPSSAEANNAWKYTSTPTIYLHGMKKGNFI
jgi:hypothetical protein